MRRKKLGLSTPRLVQHSFLKVVGSVSSRGLFITFYFSLATKDSKESHHKYT